MTKILIAEDEEDIRELIHFNLFKQDFEVFLASNGEEALLLAKENKPDLILLDIMMPKIDGNEVCKMIRENDESFGKPGIIMLTAKGAEDDVTKGLDTGADDYITKPFSPKILLSRVNALLRRKAPNTNSEFIDYQGIRIDEDKREVFIDQIEVQMTFTEFQLLKLLVGQPGIVFSRSKIVDNIRGENHAITDRSVDVQIVSLRKKLGEKGKLIETVRGVGYRIKSK